MDYVETTQSTLVSPLRFPRSDVVIDRIRPVQEIGFLSPKLGAAWLVSYASAGRLQEDTQGICGSHQRTFRQYLLPAPPRLYRPLVSAVNPFSITAGNIVKSAALPSLRVIT